MAFNEEQYYADKLAHLQATGKTQYTNINQVKQAFADAGLTAQQHQQMYGNNEGIGTTYKAPTPAPMPSYGNITQPSAFPFQNEDDYYSAKLAHLQGTGKSQYTNIDQVKGAFQHAGLTPQQHYAQYGMNEGIGSTYQPMAMPQQQMPSWMNEMQSWWNGMQQQQQAPSSYTSQAFPQYTPNYGNNALMRPVTQGSGITAQNQYGNMGYNNKRSSLWGDW